MKKANKIGKLLRFSAYGVFVMGFILGFYVSEAYAYETFVFMNLFTIWFEAFILGIALLGLAEIIFLLEK